LDGADGKEVECPSFFLYKKINTKKMENEEEQQQHLKRLEVITQDLNRLENSVKRLDCDAEMLKATVGQMDETAGAKKLAELQKRALLYTEELVRKMLDLDSLSGEKVRPVRREQVTRVQVPMWLA
jgi:hypothetical protein